MDKLRVIFKKTRQVKFISHLDLLRTFIRAIRRARIPVKYSEGFNPHAQLTFALPMAVGVTSDHEVVDITLSQSVDIMDTIKNLGRALPKGLELVEAYITLTSMPDYNRAEYLVTVENEGVFAEDIKEQIFEALRSGDIFVEKKTKKKTTQVNIIEHLHDLEVLSVETSNMEIRMVVPVGNDFTLKPELVLNGISSVVDGFLPIDTNIHRTKIYS